MMDQVTGRFQGKLNKHQVQKKKKGRRRRRRRRRSSIC
jgi:hypothetical protein